MKTTDELEFASDTKFLDVEGKPVTIGAGEKATPGMYCATWDKGVPTTFNADSALRNGAVISKKAFQALIKS